jgi:hypothetical protein
MDVELRREIPDVILTARERAEAAQVSPEVASCPHAVQPSAAPTQAAW